MDETRAREEASQTLVDFELIARPVRFDEEPTGTRRARGFDEHVDDTPELPGYESEPLIDFKVMGAVT
jgi:hypothetical protein